MTTFSSRLSELIAGRDLTQKEVAAGTGISQGAISHYLRGTRAPRVEEALTLAAYFGTNIEWLFGVEQSAREDDSNLLRRELDAGLDELLTTVASLEAQLLKLKNLTATSTRRRQREQARKNP